MKKRNLLIYGVVWALCLAVLNLAAFLSPNEIGGESKFGATFWVAYGVVTAAFIGHLICAVVAFRAKSPVRFFYRIPLLLVSYGGIVATLIAGAVFVSIPALPDWIAIVVSVAVLAFDAIAVLQSVAVADAVSDLDDAITENTFKMRELIADAEDLLHTVPEECRETAKRVYEALRYSDPVSAPGTEEAEDRIATQFYAFRDSALEGDHELAPRLADALFGLIEDRNRLCKQEKKNPTEDVK